MVIGDLLREGAKELSAAGIETARLDSEVLLSSLLRKERLYLVTHREQTVSETTETAFCELIARRRNHEPVAYLIGKREFMSLDFAVSPGVLIPRPDTETLVEFVIEKFEKAESPAILDLCTGSGAIAVSLAYYLPKSRVIAVDISETCVKTAQKNAAENGVAERVAICKADVFSYKPDCECNCIVSNPPYIPAAVIETLEPDVKKYEPHLALAGGNDGYDFYRHLVSFGKTALSAGGLLALEVGHDQAKTVAELLAQTGAYSEIGTKEDLAGISRVVYGIKK